MVDDLLNQLTSKFSNLSGEILGKSEGNVPSGHWRIALICGIVDEMSRRLDSLEAAIQVGNAKSEEENES